MRGDLAIFGVEETKRRIRLPPSLIALVKKRNLLTKAILTAWRSLNVSPLFLQNPKPDLTMDQKLEGTPKATLQLDGRAVTRSEITNDWGTRLQWQIKRDGKEIATTTAGLELTYEHADTAPGKYEVVLQQFYYVNYKKDASGKFTESKYVNISDPVSYTI